ncbi:hypothetical protein [Microbispora sp. CA-102843]|uniref:hypothetical protein n=1 Tax=Microbispora sp. CA-102843 TaxID=3239952 RepID=UPI003D8DCE89
MRAVATEAFKAYYGMQPLDFDAGEEFVGDAAVHMLRTGAPVDPVDDEARQVLTDMDMPPAPGDSFGEDPAEGPEGGEQGDQFDPDGTVAEILAWVGDDSERAIEAYEAETAKANPRKTLVNRLEELI